MNPTESRFYPRVFGLAAAGRLKPVLDQTFPLRDAARAHEMLEARQQFGKLVLVP